MTYNTMAWFLVCTLFQLWICAAVFGTEFQNEFYRGINTYYDMLPTEGILRTVVANSLVICGLVCLRDSRCQVFFYDGMNCHGYSNRMSNSVSTTHSANMIYYEKRGDIMTGATCGAGYAHSSGTPDFTFGFCEAPRVKGLDRFNIKLESDLRDCLAAAVAYLPDGRVVVLDSLNENMKMFTDGGQYLDNLNGLEMNVAMCVVDNNTVAIIDGNCRIRVVNVGSSTLVLSKTIETIAVYTCQGMTYSDERFVVSTEEKEVYSLTDNGSADILYTYATMPYYLANDPTKKGQVLVSQFTNTEGETAVSRLVLANHQSIDVLKVGVVQDAVGIYVNAAGNIYVIGSTSNNVILMSADGSRVWELLTSSDNIDVPVAISVSGDKFVVVSFAPANQNYVRVFQVY